MSDHQSAIPDQAGPQPSGAGRWAERLLKVLMVACMAVMSILVFTNVVLRYGFNSSLVLTEEVARYAFVWMTFLGGILAFARQRHVSMTLLANMLSRNGRRIVALIGDLAVLLCCYLIVKGCYELAQLNLVNRLPVTGMSVAWLYAAGLPFGLSVAGITLYRMARRLSGTDEGRLS